MSDAEQPMRRSGASERPMNTHMHRGDPQKVSKPLTVGLLIAALTIPLCVTAHGEGLEPYRPATDQLRRTILGVWESHAFRHPLALEMDVRDVLRSINEIEGRTD